MMNLLQKTPLNQTLLRQTDQLPSQRAKTARSQAVSSPTLHHPQAMYDVAVSVWLLKQTPPLTAGYFTKSTQKRRCLTCTGLNRTRSPISVNTYSCTLTKSDLWPSSKNSFTKSSASSIPWTRSVTSKASGLLKPTLPRNKRIVCKTTNSVNWSNCSKRTQTTSLTMTTTRTTATCVSYSLQVQRWRKHTCAAPTLCSLTNVLLWTDSTAL